VPKHLRLNIACSYHPSEYLRQKIPSHYYYNILLSLNIYLFSSDLGLLSFFLCNILIFTPLNHPESDVIFHLSWIYSRYIEAKDKNVIKYPLWAKTKKRPTIGGSL
jgi:hypothetical protein